MNTFRELVAYAAVVTAVAYGFVEHAKAVEAYIAFDSARSQLEAYGRTTGRNVDSEYVCHRKIAQ